MNPTRPPRVTVEVPRWVAAFADRSIQSGIVLVALSAAGLAGVGLAWKGAAATLGVWKQLAFVVSGGFGGVALTGASLGLSAVHGERRRAALDRIKLAATIETGAEVAERLPPVLANLASPRTPTAPTAAPCTARTGGRPPAKSSGQPGPNPRGRVGAASASPNAQRSCPQVGD
jgi:hypothetical protein